MKDSVAPRTGTSPLFKAAVCPCVRRAVVRVRVFVASAKELHRFSSQGHVADFLVRQHALLHAERNIEILHIADALFREHQIDGEWRMVLVELPLRLGLLAIFLASRSRKRLDEGFARSRLAEEPVKLPVRG